MAILSVANHRGDERHPDDVFFVSVAAALGTLLSASTSVNPRRPHEDSKNLWTRLLLSLLVAVMAIVFAGRFQGWSNRWVDMPAQGWVLAGLVFSVIFLLTAGEELNTFVGTEGFTSAKRYLWMIPVRAKVCRFAAASDLRTTYRRVFTSHGAYRGTAFSFEWLDPKGRVAFAIQGTVREHRIDREELDFESMERAPQYDRFHFASAAADAWDRRRADSQVTVSGQSHVSQVTLARSGASLAPPRAEGSASGERRRSVCRPSTSLRCSFFIVDSPPRHDTAMPIRHRDLCGGNRWNPRNRHRYDR